MLDPCLQYKWNGRRRRAKKPYENRAEVDLVLAKYKDKLYTVVTVMDDYDKRIRDRIIVVLVRIAQKGNITARQEAITYIRYTVDEWIEKYYVLQRWSGFGELLEEEIAACIRRYRFRRFLFCFFCIFQSMVRIDHATGDNKLGRCRRQSDVGKEYSCDKLDIYGHFFRIRIRPRFDHSFKWKSNS